LLVCAPSPAVLEELVDERGLAVVDVGDDGDVADVLVHANGLGCDAVCAWAVDGFF